MYDCAVGLDTGERRGEERGGEGRRGEEKRANLQCKTDSVKLS